MDKTKIIELLEKLRAYIVKVETNHFFGMCAEVTEMYEEDLITSDEYDDLDDYIVDRVPRGLCKIDYWWPRGEKQPRFDWIDEQVKILKDE